MSPIGGLLVIAFGAVRSYRVSQDVNIMESLDFTADTNSLLSTSDSILAEEESEDEVDEEHDDELDQGEFESDEGPSKRGSKRSRSGSRSAGGSRSGGGSRKASSRSRSLSRSRSGSRSPGGKKCVKLGTPKDMGKLDGAIHESSGIACSRFINDVCYTHNDSQDKPRIFAINTKGELLATINIKKARAKDWEDIAIAGNMIYIGDIGDNRAARKTETIYRIEEPEIDPDWRGETITVTAENFSYDMPEGANQNCESMFVDSAGEMVYIITKKPDKGETDTAKGKLILKVPWGGEMAEMVGSLGGSIRGKVTGADMDPNDSLIAVRTYTHVYMYKVSGEEPEEALQKEPCAYLKHKEKQGEAIGWSGDGKKLYTTSEGIGLPVYEISVDPA